MAILETYPNLLGTLVDLCSPGLYVILNEEDRKVWVGQTHSFLEAFSRMLSGLRDGTYPSKPLRLAYNNRKIRIEIIETCTDKTERLLKLGVLCEEYKSRGYELYNKRDGLKYTPKLRIVQEDYKFYAQVVLKNRNHGTLVVGVFEEVEEAEQFMKTYYSGKIVRPVYSTNDLTRSYIRTHRPETIEDILANRQE